MGQADDMRLGQAESAAEIADLTAEVKRLRAALQRIDGINDNPAIYNPAIEMVLRDALSGPQ